MSKQHDVILEMKNVTRTFTQAGQKINALKKTDFTIKAGEMVAVIGPSGSGKTTFLTIAGGLQNPTHGTVIIRGKNITKLSQKQLSATRLNEVGFILQASNLVPFLTVEKQLKLLDKVYRRPTDTKGMTTLFKTLQIEKNRTKYPSDLSGGERQRAAIAKVLYGNSNLILADEPTASLDTTRAFEVISLLAKETHERKKATIIVTHDERLLKYCDAVYEMHDGELKKRKK
ncbi:ABC transporter ATP-binding protein [Candidatus Saccharibacteria bacterium TM7i]|nr:ABC transporter ATP-binding protein [Candidatus Saccharibacteria bacterium TM7i]